MFAHFFCWGADGGGGGGGIASPRFSSIVALDISFAFSFLFVCVVVFHSFFTVFSVEPGTWYA